MAGAGPCSMRGTGRRCQVGDKGSIGIRLLTDLRDYVFKGIDRLPTVAVLDRLHSLEEAPWADMSGKPLDARGLA